MAYTTIREAVEEIGACPTLGRHQQLMMRVLTNHEFEFGTRPLFFTVSMYMRLNVSAEECLHGIRRQEQDERTWFTLGPHGYGLALVLGIGFEILSETVLPENDAKDLIQKGIGHVTGLGDSSQT